MKWSRLIAVSTDRLQLRALTAADLLALHDGDAQFTTVSGLVAAEGLRGFLVSDEVSPAWLDRLRVSVGADVWHFGFGVVERASGIVVGASGYKGPPDDLGVVEIAYGIVPSRQGRGYATEVAGALVQFASADARVRRIIAHTLPEPNASTRVLTKSGFEHVGAVEDPEDGLVWRWERDPEGRFTKGQ
jgi:ribosomal-protein-alanine N-acetyltransferase